MLSELDQLNSLDENIEKIPEVIVNPSITTTTSFYDMKDLVNEKKEISLISIYDNNSQQGHLAIGILGHNQRAQAFFKRLFLSGFNQAIFCEKNFDFSSLNILLITEYIDDLSYENKQHQQLFIDVRESHLSSDLLRIPCTYRAFGNLSNWEIEHGTDRISVFVEQSVPISLIKFISDFKCFSRGITYLDSYSYNNQQRKPFRNCLFSFVTILLIFSLVCILSLIQQTRYASISIYQQASSIMATTSITLLAVVFFIRPMIEIIECIFSLIFKRNEILLHKSKFLQNWLQSRRYLCWSSLSFALLHLLFLIVSKLTFIFSTFLFGLLSLICLFIISFVYFPWISAYLIWKEYHFFSFYIGPITLLLSFLHLYLHWNYELNLQFLSMIFPLIVLILRFLLYGFIRPIEYLKKHRQMLSFRNLRRQMC